MILTHLCDRCTLPIEQGKEFAEYVVECFPIRITKVVKAFTPEDVEERHKKHPAMYIVHESTEECMEHFKKAITGLMRWAEKKS